MSAIPTGISRDDVLAAILDLDNGVQHEFGKSTGYDLVENGKRYPPKAVLGLAARRLLGRPLGPYDFQGGEKSESVRTLRDLGFVVIRKSAAAQPGDDWSEEEGRAVVEDYFEMLRLERAGLPYSKAAHNRALQERLPARSKGSIEFKHANISAILDEQNYPYIQGYKPRKNFQRDIFLDIVLEFLGTGEGVMPAIESAVETVTSIDLEAVDLEKAEVPPPERESDMEPAQTSKTSRRARKVDFAAKDSANRSLGRAGELFVLRWERWKLETARRSDLAARIEWVSESLGDGLGYDIRSFDATNGDEVFIEVKSTNCGEQFPFFLSQNEIEASIEFGERYRLYRVFNLSINPQFYQVRGDLRAVFNLRPRLYEARC